MKFFAIELLFMTACIVSENIFNSGTCSLRVMPNDPLG